MEKQKNKTIVAIALALILTISALMVIAPTNTADAQDDLSQYEWTMGGYDPEYTRFSPGPAPDRPDVLWKVEGISMTSRGGITIFDGKAFVPSATGLLAFDAFTGELLYDTPYPARIRSDLTADPTKSSWVTKIDDEYMHVYHRYQMDCYKIETGEAVWSIPMYIPWGAGSGYYWHGVYVPETKTHYIVDMGEDGIELEVLALDMSDPSKPPPTLWRYRCDEGAEIAAYGDGKVFVTAYQASLYALDAETGELLWRKQTHKTLSYSATYQDGKVYVGSAATSLTAYDANTGETVWEYEAGGRAFFQWGFALAYGNIYAHVIPAENTYFGAWDIETGQPLWQVVTPVGGYSQPVVADGKVFFHTGDTTTCFDAFTGEILWQIPYILYNPSIAYGNLYGYGSGAVWCIGPPKSWSMWRGSTDTPGVGQSAPETIDFPRWTFETDGPVSSSPAVVDGKVYVGSHDQNIYCLDAYDGTLVWKFGIDYKVQSSLAVVGGRVYTGADDGSIYALNANTGAEIWKTWAGGKQAIVFAPTWQPSSSPIVVGNRLYVGALDGKVYCLNTATGNILWKYQTENPIGGSPAVSNGVVYIRSAGGYLYALSATDGALVWKTDIVPWSTDPGHQYHYDPLRHVGSPIVVDGVVFVQSGVDMFPPADEPRFFALDATDGTVIWAVPLVDWMYPISTPTYFDGVLYMGEGNGITSRHASNGTLINDQFLGHLVMSSPAFADDPRGAKVYIGCSVYSITCLDAATLTPLSVYTTNGQIESSPAIWEGKVYVGSQDWNVYCFGDARKISGSAPMPIANPTEPAPAVQAQLQETAPSPTIESTTITPINTYLIAAAVAAVAVIVAAAIFLRKRK